jgi:glutamyl-tRNA synthetase
LSKRQGDVAVEDYRSKGFLKEALVNFVALLGWNAGDDKEFYYLNELVENFSLERVNKAGAVFDLEKLNWLNAEHLRKKSETELLSLLKEELINSPYAEQNFSDSYLLHVITAMKERISFVKEILTKSSYFFEAPSEYEESALQKNWKPETPEQLMKLRDAFSLLENPSKEDFEHALAGIAGELNISKGKLIHPLRLSISGVSGGPGVFDIVVILGKEETLKRIQTALAKIK